MCVWAEHTTQTKPQQQQKESRAEENVVAKGADHDEDVKFHLKTKRIWRPL